MKMSNLWLLLKKVVYILKHITRYIVAERFKLTMACRNLMRLTYASNYGCYYLVIIVASMDPLLTP